LPQAQHKATSPARKQLSVMPEQYDFKEKIVVKQENIL
jgi:hypothetical protein